jgi:hypothetical protein
MLNTVLRREGIIMRYKTRITIACVLCLMALVVMPSLGQAKEAPPNVIAALIVKLAALEKNISGAGDVSVYVLGSADVAAELKKLSGEKIGGATLSAVMEGAGMPGVKPHILYIGDGTKLGAATSYTQSNKALSVSGVPGSAEKGASLGLEIGDDGKPKITLNLTSSKAEGLDWNPAIMKIVQTTK